MVLNIFRHIVQAFLFGGTHDGDAQICVLKCDAGGYMDMAVDDAWYDEFPAKIGGITIIGSKAGLVAHIDKLPVLYRKGGRLWIVLFRCENPCVLDDLVCLHLNTPCIKLALLILSENSTGDKGVAGISTPPCPFLLAFTMALGLLYIIEKGGESDT